LEVTVRIVGLGERHRHATRDQSPASKETEVLRMSKIVDGNGDQLILDPMCLWCGRTFTPRSTGGRRQRVCLPAPPRAVDSAARRHTYRLVTTGQLSVAHLHGPGTTRALLPAASGDEAATPLAKPARSRAASAVSILWAGAHHLTTERHRSDVGSQVAKRTCIAPGKIGSF